MKNLVIVQKRNHAEERERSNMDYSNIEFDEITIDNCIEMYVMKTMVTEINNGHVLDFTERDY